MSEEAQGIAVHEDLLGMFGSPWFWVALAAIVGTLAWQSRHELR